MGKMKAHMMELEDKFFEDIQEIMENEDCYEARLKAAMQVIPDEINAYIDLQEIEIMLNNETQKQ